MEEKLDQEIEAVENQIKTEIQKISSALAKKAESLNLLYPSSLESFREMIHALELDKLLSIKREDEEHLYNKVNEISMILESSYTKAGMHVPPKWNIIKKQELFKNLRNRVKVQEGGAGSAPSFRSIIGLTVVAALSVFNPKVSHESQSSELAIARPTLVSLPSVGWSGSSMGMSPFNNSTMCLIPDEPLEPNTPATEFNPWNLIWLIGAWGSLQHIKEQEKNKEILGGTVNLTSRTEEELLTNPRFRGGYRQSHRQRKYKKRCLRKTKRRN
jgi:hypothetical protein